MNNNKVLALEKLVTLLKGGDISKEQFEKATRNISHLVKKKVQITGKNGQTFYAYRWVDPGTGESEKVIGKKPKIPLSGDFESRMNQIISSDVSDSEKARAFINEGVYDKDIFSLFCPKASYSFFLSKGAGIDPKSLEEKKDSQKTEQLKEKIRDEQSHNDTPEDREGNEFLREISVDKIWDNYERNLNRVIIGRHKFAVAYGTGGVGKTFTFRKLAKEKQLRQYDPEIQPNKDQYDYVVISGKITATQVYAEMYRHRDKLIVFDDCDSFLKMDEVQGFLKAGLDTGDDTRIDNKSGATLYQVQGDKESGKIPNSFRFTGRVIAITNLSSQDLDQAVRSRALVSNLTMTVDETIEKLGGIKDKIEVLSADKTESLSIRKEARELAFEVLKEKKDMLGGDINTRIYSNAMLLAEDGFNYGDSEESIRQDIIGYFNDVKGTLDEKIRKINKK